MVPTVRQALLTKAAQAKAAGADTGLVFRRKDGRIIAYSTKSRAWRDAVDAAHVRPIRTYDMRHIYASLLVMAQKNALYISKQMGHHDPAFTYKVYGHLLESLPKRQVEWIDELVFPEGLERALKAHAAAAPSRPKHCSRHKCGPGQRTPAKKPQQVQRDGSRMCKVSAARLNNRSWEGAKPWK